MFENKKLLKKIEIKQKELKEKEEELKEMKEQLLFIEQNMKDTSSKIDISNVYVWCYNGIYSLVYINEKKIVGEDIARTLRDGYKSTVTDVFSGKVIYEKSSISKIESPEIIFDSFSNMSNYAYIYTLYHFDKDLLAFTDNKVPEYILKQLLFKLNNVDVKKYILNNNK